MSNQRIDISPKPQNPKTPNKEFIAKAKRKKSRDKWRIYNFIVAFLIISYYGDYITSAAVTCTSGKYLNTSNVCATCPAGSYCPGDNKKYPCDIGFANSLTGQTSQASCTICPQGTYSYPQGSASCTPCSLGSTNLSSGSSGCTLCTPGYERSSDNTICNICNAGTFSNSDSLSCTSCPKNSVCTAQGCINCQFCQIGYVPNSTGTGCTKCGVGTFALIGYSSCKDCDPMYYASTQGSSSCTKCPDGYYSLSKSSSCTPCPAGQYLDAVSASCKDCDTGMFCSKGGCSVCTVCAEGTVLNSLATGCDNCLAGTYSEKGWNVCSECSPGYYSGEIASSCIKCPSGSFCNSNKCTSCSICPAGTSSSSDSITCIECTAGTFSNSGSSSCTKCPDNTYSESNASSCILCSTGFYSTSGDQVCHTICGDGLRVGLEQCDDGDNINNNGCSNECTIETGYACEGGTNHSPDICYIVCGDGIIISPETCDDCNKYDGDGCSATCQIEPKYECQKIPDCSNYEKKCTLICGNGVINPGEKCDDGNLYNFDGCSNDCLVEAGFLCSETSQKATSTCIQNKFMPSAQLEVLSNNNLIITFNDTIKIVNPTENDLYIEIYGSQTSYKFTWTASFKDSSTLLVNMMINSEITGQGEQVYVEFEYSNRFYSIYSDMCTNPELTLNGLLNANLNSNTSNFLRQVILYAFLISVLISILSLFGGNCMELMWIFTNYLQLIYYISAVNVNFPDIIKSLFSSIKFCNADIPFFSPLSYMLIPERNFIRGDVSDRIGSKSFFMSASDKLPWLLPVVILFCVIKLTDFCKKCDQICCLKYIYRLINYLKYNFFLRICIEQELEIAFTATVNIFFYDFSNRYEIISITLAALFLVLLLIFFCFITYFILCKSDELRISPCSFDRYSCLFCEIDSKNSLSLYWLHVFFIRRLYFCFGLIFFYHSKNIQLMVCITSSFISLIYAIYSNPYKKKIFNISTIFNEICFCVLCCMVFAFSEIKIDQSSGSFTDSENKFSDIFVDIFYLTIGINFAYLYSIKIYEIYCIIKKIIRWYKYKVNIEAKISKEAHNPQNNTTQLPQNFTSQTTDNECLVHVVPKWRQRCLERERKNEQEDERMNPYHRDFLKKYEVQEENKNHLPRRKTEISNFDKYRMQITEIHYVDENSQINS